MQFAVAHQNESGIVRYLRPLVKVKGQRISPLDTFEPGSQLRNQHGQGPKCAVDMKPELLTRGNLGDSGKVVDSARVHRTSAAHHEKGLQSCCSIGGNR